MKRYLSRDAIKFLAILAMTGCHISQIFLTPSPRTVWMQAGASFTAACMCWFVTEGARKTSSLENYARRLLVFTVISQVPYCLAFTKYHVIEWQGLNMIYTLLMVFLMTFFMLFEPDTKWRIIYTAAAAAAALAGDWGIYAVIFTLLFVWAGEDRYKQAVSFGISFLTLFGATFIHRMLFGAGFIASTLTAFGESAGILLAGGLIICLYNGRRAAKGAAFWKWAFYVYYPLHLTVLGILRLLMKK